MLALLAAPADAKAPPAAASRYVKTTEPRKLRRFGCSEGHFVLANRGFRNVLVVLAFGRPTYHDRRYGASLFGDRPASLDRIRKAAQAYALGYLECSRGSRTRLRLAVGTSNFGPGVNGRHGRAWAQMVNRANRWLRARGPSPRVTIYGAIDIELAWNGPAVTRSWVRGYDAVARWPYFDFGAAEMCPPFGGCWAAWTLEDVWYVAAGARTARPLPQIYTPSGSMARQWYNLALYAHRRHGRAMRIQAVMSQRAACDQSSDPCTGMNNSPQQAWLQLQRLLNSDPRTAQRINWITDIRWRGVRDLPPLERRAPAPRPRIARRPARIRGPGPLLADTASWAVHLL